MRISDWSSDVCSSDLDRRDRVGRGRFALLVHPVVARDRAVRGLGFHRLAIGGHQHAGHQAERAEALRDGVRLDVAVVILAGPDELARPFERRRSEEHTSELQSLMRTSYAVFCLKKTKYINTRHLTERHETT